MFLLPSLTLLIVVARFGTAIFPSSCPAISASSSNSTIGVCPQDFAVIGGALEAVHESITPPTGIAVDASMNVYLTYPRNGALTPNNVVLTTSFTGEEPWPSAEIQNCTVGQDPSTCFINVQNVVLDSLGQMWVVDNGYPPGAAAAVPGGSKLMAFDTRTRCLLKTVLIPQIGNGTNANDLRINNTLGTAGTAFITDVAAGGSLVAIDLATGSAVRRLWNTTVVRADPSWVAVYDGQPKYCWKGTTRNFCATGADGIALASGNVYWGVLSSRRFYYAPQAVLANASASEDEARASVVFPGELGSEQAGFTADDNGRVYMLASEQNAIFYADTQLANVNETVNGVLPGGPGPVPPNNYVVKALVRSGLIQHADSAAVMNGYLYFCTNQINLSAGRQYNNTDARKGPYRSYRYFIGAGPAV